MKIDPVFRNPSPQLPASGMSPGIFPYLGGSVSADQLGSVMRTYEGAIVSGKNGAKLAAKTPGVLVDPAAYTWPAKIESGMLFDYEEWLIRQRTAGVPVILTDTRRIRNGDRSALQKALKRWAAIDEPTLVVLPIEPWWLRAGLSWLTDEVREAGRPVAIVVLHHYNGLDAGGVIAGLLTFIAAVEPLPVILLRCDISAIGAVAHRAFAGFVGWSANTRHGPLPIRQPSKNAYRDGSPSVLVPALNDYVKASKLPAFAHNQRLDVLRCDDPVCGGGSLLGITDRSEVDLRTGRMLACQHDMASTEQLARRIFSAAEPRDAWREACNSAATLSASLAESGLSLPLSRWLRQWLDTGSPAYVEPYYPDSTQGSIHGMKVSVSLPEDDVEFLDSYARNQGAQSRSAVLHKAVGLLRAAQLADAYEEAWDSWASSEDAAAWETVAADGLAS